jgi:hypothetical protein
MNILLPLDCKDEEEAKLVSLNDVKAWAFIDFNEGRVQKLDFFDTKDQIDDFIDCVVVTSDKEYVWPFMEENIAVLVAPTQRYIEDVIEAFLFKELHDLSI